MASSRFVGHIDADCFYVSAERVRHATLAGLPVGVLGNQGACVIAKSYEMKAAGITTGMPIWDARKLCPQGIYVKRDFRWYEVLSRLMLDVVRDFSPRVEFYSIDEFFFEAIPERNRMAQELAAAIRDHVWKTVRVPVTVGIARSRTLAKLISDAAKPFGALAVIEPDKEELLLKDRPVTEITGIAGRREKRLLPWGLVSCLDLARADRRLVRQLLTVHGEILWWELNGEAVQPIRSSRPVHKALSRGGSFGEPTERPGVLYAWLVRNIERLIEELRYHELFAGHLAVWVGYRDGHPAEGQAAPVVPTDRFDLLLDAARHCPRCAWRPRIPAERMHVIATKLSRRAEAQLSLFDPPSAQAEAIAAVKERVNTRMGRFALRSAATLPLAAVYRGGALSYDVCDVRGKTCF
jgi:nucleotidyltransferase/DNA polymerase involved in DNA repair